MEYRALRRAHAVVENGGFLAVPAAYVGIALFKASARDPSLALFTMGYVLFLVWRGRQAAASLAFSPRGKGEGPKSWPQEALDAADRGFLRDGALRACFDLLCYLALLLALDAFLRPGTAGPLVPLVLGFGALAVFLIAGARVTKALVWQPFAYEYPEIWSAPDGLNLGGVVRSPSRYLAWRETARPKE